MLEIDSIGLAASKLNLRVSNPPHSSSLSLSNWFAGSRQQAVGLQKGPEQGSKVKLDAQKSCLVKSMLGRVWERRKNSE